MARHISGVSMAGLPLGQARQRPLLLVANHVSWWDGFLLMEIRRCLRPTAPFHTLMLETELAKSSFLRRIGTIGIDPASPASILRAARELSARLEKRPDSLVFFFPQGRIWPSRRRPLGFERGAEAFMKSTADVTVLPVGIHIEPLTRFAPHAFLSIGTPISSTVQPSASDLEHAVEHELDNILRFLDEHGEDAVASWPEAHSSLPPPVQQ
jgi:1-acyl-sn-glycerol-3-phosphate acyltransferase